MCRFCDVDFIEEDDWWEVCALYVETKGNWHAITIAVGWKMARQITPAGSRVWWPSDIKEIFLGHILDVLEVEPTALEEFEDTVVMLILEQARRYCAELDTLEDDDDVM